MVLTRSICTTPRISPRVFLGPEGDNGEIEAIGAYIIWIRWLAAQPERKLVWSDPSGAGLKVAGASRMI